MKDLPVNVGYSASGSSITNALLYQLSYSGLLSNQVLSYLLRRRIVPSVSLFVPVFDLVPYKIRHRLEYSLRALYMRAANSPLGDRK